MTTRMDLLVANNSTAQHFEDLPVPYQLAIVFFMAVDGDAWDRVDLPLLTEENQHAVLTEMLPMYREMYGNTVFGVATLSTAALQASVMADPEIADSFASWDEYHRAYLSGGAPEHPETDRWPVILSDEDSETLRDGWHRFHSYVRDGAVEIPVVFFPRMQHLSDDSAAA